jgi:hypothetical protein
LSNELLDLIRQSSAICKQNTLEPVPFEIGDTRSRQKEELVSRTRVLSERCLLHLFQSAKAERSALGALVMMTAHIHLRDSDKSVHQNGNRELFHQPNIQVDSWRISFMHEWIRKLGTEKGDCNAGSGATGAWVLFLLNGIVSRG